MNQIWIVDVFDKTHAIREHLIEPALSTTRYYLAATNRHSTINSINIQRAESLVSLGNDHEQQNRSMELNN